MEWLTMMLIGVAANLDNLGVGVAYGVQATKIPIKSNIIIALIGAIITYLSVSIGSMVGASIDPDFAHIGGGVILFAIGSWTLWNDWKRLTSSYQKNTEGHYLQKILENPEKADTDNNKIISSTESFFLGLALSLNCFGVGIGGGITGVSPLWSGIVVGCISFCTMAIGVRMGIRLSYSWFHKFAGSIAGVLLLGMGLCEIFL